MDSTLLRRIVFVRAHFENSAEARIGTGLRLAPGLILTSQHVVEREGEAADRIEIKLKVGGELVSGSAEPLWRGETDLVETDLNARDAVLLRDDLPAEDLEPFLEFLVEPLTRSAEWEGAGYARHTPTIKKLRATELCGRVAASKAEDIFLELTVDRLAPGTQDENWGWAGVSGAPVFLAKGPRRGSLCGVVRTNPRLQSDTLYAVSMPWLLRDKTFRGHLNLDQGKRLERLLAELRLLFTRHRELAERAARLHEAWEEAWEETGEVDDLLEAIRRHGSLPDVLERLSTIQEDGEGVQHKALQEMSGLLAALVSRRSLPCHQRDFEGRRLHVATSSPNLAELSVAGHDDAPGDFVPVPGDWPVARLRAPLPTNLEGGVGLEQKARDQQQILDEYLFNVLNEKPWIVPASIRFLKRLPTSKKRKQWIETINLRLRRIADRNRQRFPYVVADHEFRESLGERAELFLEKLAEAFPELRQVELTGDPDDRPAEDDSLEPLWEILHLLPEENDP